MYFEIKYILKNISFCLFCVCVVIFTEAKMYNDTCIIRSFILEGNIIYYENRH